ncbi:hypothetical protein TNCT_399421, partial [Trichonephila clavata]
MDVSKSDGLRPCRVGRVRPPSPPEPLFLDGPHLQQSSYMEGVNRFRSIPKADASCMFKPQYSQNLAK